MTLPLFSPRSFRFFLLLWIAAAAVNANSIEAQIVRKPSIRFSADAYEATESDGIARIEIRRWNDTNEAVSVTFIATSSNPKHFLPQTNLVEFAAGETNRVVEVTLVDDEVRGQEFELGNLILRSPSANATIGSPGSANLVIRDDDLLTVGFRRTSVRVRETNGPVAIELFRRGRRNEEVRVRASATSSRLPRLRLFTPTTNEIVFAPGETNAFFWVSVNRDYERSGGESASLRLSGVSTGFILNPSSAFLDISEADSAFAFAGPFSARENAGPVVAKVMRVGASDVAASVDLVAVDGTAQSGVDFEVAPTRLEFPAGQTTAEFTVKLLDDERRQGRRTFTLQLQNPVGALLPTDRVGFSIDDDDGDSLPGGLTEDFAGSGFNRSVNSLVRLADGRLLVGGEFTRYRNEPATNVVIVLPSGDRDPSFSSTGTTSGWVDSVVALADGRILAVGFFNDFGGQPHRNAVVLGPDGTAQATPQLDFDFNPRPIVSLPNGGILVRSSPFNRLNGQPVASLIRLTADGQLDPTFTSGTNWSSGPQSILAQSDGSFFADGTWRDESGNLSFPIRFRPDGNPDLGFVGGIPLFTASGFSVLPDGTVATGASTRFFGNGAVEPSYGDQTRREILLTLPDGRIIAREQNRLVRLFSDGLPDGEFRADFDGTVHGVVASENETLIIAGDFHSVDGLERSGIARLRGDDPAAPARIRWHGTRFAGLEELGAVRIPLLRTGDLSPEQTVHYRTVSDTAQAGVDFAPVDANLAFAPGERVKLIEIQLLARPGEPDRQFHIELSGGGVGPVGALATVTILRRTGTIEFESARQTLLEGARGGQVAIRRNGGIAYPASVDLLVSGTGTRLLPDYSNSAEADFLGPWPAQVDFAPGESRLFLSVSSQDDAAIEGPETLQYALTGASPGNLIGGTAQHLVNLLDDDSSLVPSESYWPGGFLHPRPGGGIWRPAGIQTSSGYRLGPIALRKDGSLDESVPPPAESGSLLGVYPDGRLLMARYGRNPQTECEFYRLLPNAQRDPEFAPQLLTLNNPQPFGYWLEFSGRPTPDGGAVVAIYRGDSSQTSRTGPLQLTRLDLRGQPMASFRNATTNWSFTLLRRPTVGLAVQSTGHVLMVGSATAANASPSLFPTVSLRQPLVRLLPSGSLDLSFQMDLGPLNSRVNQFAVLADDQLLVAGMFDAVNGVSRPGLVRLSPDGAVDLSFVPDSRLADHGAEITAVTSTADGRVLVANGNAVGQPGAQIYRLTSVGTLDLPFDSPRFNDRVVSMVALPDGRFVALGAFDQANGEWRSGIAWFDERGALLAETPLVIRGMSETPTLSLRVAARASIDALLESSADLGEWTPEGTISLRPGLNEVLVPPSSSPNRLLRVRW
ncbi:MAG TPA: Calx-beta domain-containing protein [Verrucomicrobiota bacterium]|nr:Calx-beta domain-containing protein [Verrucomicrobiota bacterium]